jgi:hypothetical protein
LGLGFGLGAGAGVGVGDRVRVRGLMCAPREDDQLRALRQADRGEGRPRRRVEHTRGVARAAVDRKGRMRGGLEVAHLVVVSVVVSVALVSVAGLKWRTCVSVSVSVSGLEVAHLVGVALVGVALVSVALVGVALVSVALVGVAVVSVALVNVAVVGVAVVEGVEGLSEQRRARRECVKWCA